MELFDEIKLSNARRAYKESHELAMKFVDLMWRDTLEGNIIEPADGRMIFQECIREIEKRIKTVEFWGFDTTTIDTDIELVKGTYKNWYQNYSYKG